MPERPHHQPPASLTVATAAAVVLLLGLVAPRPVLAANELVDPLVTPTSGTSATFFTLSVESASTPPREPESVVALVDDATVSLTLVDGTPENGRYSGSVTDLPPGEWPVTFRATAQGNNPTLPGPTIQVVEPSTPTPVPTPVPTQPSTPAPPGPPSATPTPPNPSSSPPPGGSTARPVPTPLASVTAGSADPPGDGGRAGAAPVSTSGDDASAALGSSEEATSAVVSDGRIGAPSPGSVDATDAVAGISDFALWIMVGTGIASIGLFVLVVQAIGGARRAGTCRRRCPAGRVNRGRTTTGSSRADGPPSSAQARLTVQRRWTTTITLR